RLVSWCFHGTDKLAVSQPDKDKRHSLWQPGSMLAAPAVQGWFARRWPDLPDEAHRWTGRHRWMLHPQERWTQQREQPLHGFLRVRCHRKAARFFQRLSRAAPPRKYP